MISLPCQRRGRPVCGLYNVCIVEFDDLGGVVFYDVFPKFGPILSRPWWENLM